MSFDFMYPPEFHLEQVQVVEDGTRYVTQAEVDS